mmetsp:Transcript_1317/g.1178  ORF Transcript_1317/g.1178 Transcript_1317/m.1178 type:complete len:203 (-) Transcript_1317:46-654(-)
MILCWLNSEVDDKVYDTNQCHSKMFWAILAWYLPFHIRFWQCINKWWTTGDAFPHLVNAGKYFASIIMICANYFFGRDPSLRNYIIALTLFATVYSYIWDIVMDWGLMRDKRMLRKQILYPPSYYYFSSFTNLFLRFAWVLGFLPATYWPDFFRSVEGLTLALAVMEIYRRAQWSLFRLENENINNYEKYRTVLEIPRLPKD